MVALVVNRNKILLVEDEPINQLLVGSMIKSSGYSFDLAENGLNAFRLATNNIYQLILMDIELPDINGMEVTRKIRRKNKAQKQVPIVALTSCANKKVKDKCFASGMNGFASKPISRERLCFLIGEYVNKN